MIKNLNFISRLNDDMNQQISKDVEKFQKIFHSAVIEKNSIEYLDKNTRQLAVMLLNNEKINMSDYVSLFGGNSVYNLSVDSNGSFVDMKTGEHPKEIIEKYSLAKYGCIDSIHFFAKILINYLTKEITSEDSPWHSMFVDAKQHGDKVVLMTTGWANVPSTANVLYNIVVTHINLLLDCLGFPHIIDVKLPRIAPACENYATLTKEERERISKTQDHIIPDYNFYEHQNVHVLFGDDVLITGATADKVLYESIKKGAKSFRSIYPVAIDPCIAIDNAEVEEKLNTIAYQEKLDNTLATILNNKNYVPILRTLRTIFAEKNSKDFDKFLLKVENSAWLKIYIASLNNGFLQQDNCREVLLLLQQHLIKAKLIQQNGMSYYYE